MPVKAGPLSALLRCVLCAFAALAAAGAAAQGLPLDKIRLPPGFDITLFAGNVPNARGMAWGDRGTLFVGSRERGQGLRDPPQGRQGRRRCSPSRATSTCPTASRSATARSTWPRSTASCASTTSRRSSLPTRPPRCGRARRPRLSRRAAPRLEVHRASAPTAGSTSRSARRATSASPMPRHGRITRIDADGSGYEVVARGVRNTVGFDWHPGTGELWFTDNGRDCIGDDLPPDELNHAPQRRACTSAFPTATAATCPTRSSAPGTRCGEFTPPRPSSGRTSPRSACASTPARSSRPNTATRSSSPSTARGTAARRSATA